MINLLTLALTHSLMAIAVILLLSRDELDDEDAKPKRKPSWAKAKQPPQPDSEAAD